MPKPAPMSLVMKKGQAAPVADAQTTKAAPLNESVEPVAATTPRKTPTDRLLPMSFKVPPEFDQAFRDVAHAKRMKLNELFFDCFKAYQSIHSEKK